MTMPVFTIKAKDRLAVSAVIAYRDLCLDNGLIDQADQVQLAIQEMVTWRAEHEDLVQPPDHKHVPAAPTSPSEPEPKITSTLRLERTRLGQERDGGDSFVDGWLNDAQGRTLAALSLPTRYWEALEAALGVSVEPVPSTPRVPGSTERPEGIQAELLRIAASPDAPPDRLLHAVDQAAPGRFGFGVHDSELVEDLCRAVVAGLVEHLGDLASEES